MSDWRQSDSEKSKRKSKYKSPKPIVSASQLAPKPTGGWRGKRAGKSRSSADPTRATRSWTGTPADQETLAGSSVRKWLTVGLLMIAASVLTVWLIQTVWHDPDRLPLFVFSVGEYASAPEMLENPYGNVQREQLKGVNMVNIMAREEVKNGNDNALSALSSSTWIDRFEDVDSEIIGAGGPDGRVVAFYISAMAGFPAENRLTIYPQGTSPFGDEQGLQLADALRALAVSVYAESSAWVILDLHLPPVVSNLGDLDRQWRKAAEAALQELDESLRDRLLLTLACDDGEQNWLAPEFSNSFFGHHLCQLLDGRHAKRTMLDSNLSFGELRELLGKRVTSDVSNRRSAEQNPVWLPESNLERFESIDVVTFDRVQPELRSESTWVPSQFTSIRELWGKLGSRFERAYRWDPLGYAKVESQLLALEEVALYQPESFVRARRLVDEAISQMQQPALGFEVSLIEDTQREKYFLGKRTKFLQSESLALKFAEELLQTGRLDAAAPSFWRSAVEGDPATDEIPAPEDALAPAEKCWLVWRLYEHCLVSDKSTTTIPQQLFQRERLQAALAYASDGSWLEIYMLRRLAEDIDWEANDANRAQACARGLSLFARIQRLATRPEAEVGWWLRDDREGLPPIEQRFLKAFDRVLAGQSLQAVSEFDQIEPQLQSLEQTVDQLARTVATTHEALYDVPHLLAWLLKEYQLAPEGEKTELETRLHALGETAQLTNDIYPYLSRRPGGRLDPGMLSASTQLARKLAVLKVAFADYVDDKTSRRALGGANINPQTFRRDRIALLSPLLSLEARQRLHDSTLQFVGMDFEQVRDQGGQINPPQRSTRSATDAYFLPPITTERDRWSALAKSDPRMTLAADFAASPLPSAVEAIHLRSELLELEHWQRASAMAFGHAPTLHARLARARRASRRPDVEWPWSCPWQRWTLSSANNRVLQVERLANAKWGNGSYRDDSIPEEFYFYRLIRKIELPPGFKSLAPTNRLADGFEAEISQAASTAIDQLKSLQIIFGDAYQTIGTSGTQRAPVRVAGESLDAVAQVYLGTPANRLPWLKSEPHTRGWVVDLGQADPEARGTKLEFDASYWSESRQPMGTLSVRGNVRSGPLQWKPIEEKQSTVELLLTHEPADGAVIRVRPPDEPPPVTVLLLVDCSKSMDIEVKFLDEQQKTDKGPLFKPVKQTVKGVLAKLKEIHDAREANVRVGLIPFGLNQQQIAEPLKKLIRGGQDNFYAPKFIREVDRDWQKDLEQAIDSLVPSGDTPLYDAIALACEQARVGERTLIYVFTDGVNFVDDPARRPRSKSVADIQRLISQNAQLRLSIFDFDYFAKWINTVDTNEREDARRIFEAGRKQLLELRSLGAEQYGYYREVEASKLMQDSIDSIPRSTVRIVSQGTAPDRYDSQPQPLGERIPIPQEFLPAKLNVNVTGNASSSSAMIEVEALGGERLQLSYDARGRFELPTFDDIGKDERAQSISGGNLSSRLYVMTLRERLDTTHELGLELHFWNGSQTEFTSRPRFLVAELSRIGERRPNTMLLADHHFRSATHFPEAQLSYVPWPSRRQAARLRVWAADSIPSQVRQLSVAPQQSASLELGLARVDYAHRGNQVEVRVAYDRVPRAEDRVVVICPDYFKASRVFDQDTHEEKHAFTLPASIHNQPVQIQLATIAELEEAALADEVTECIFEENLQY